MRNKALPTLLRQLARNQIIRVWTYDNALNEAATELEKLDKIETLIQNETATNDNILMTIRK